MSFPPGEGGGAKAWTNPRALKERLLGDWSSGKLPMAALRETFADRGPSETIPPPGDGSSPRDYGFPLRVPLRGPSAPELVDRFAEARRWIAELAAAEGSPGFRLEWRSFRHRQLGQNRLPEAAVFDRLDDALAFAGKRREAGRLAAVGRSVVEAYPSLLPWLLRHPLQALERETEWPALLGVLDWFRAHPRSGRYLRQIDAPGAHSKFVESRRALLSELLDLVLEPGTIDAREKGAAGFARRYGLAEKPTLVRFRSLDPSIVLSVASAASVSAVAELALRESDFSKLFPPGLSPFGEIFITENEINFIAFPEHPRAAVLLGGGYGFVQLSRAAWLRGPRLRYWGDLDTHGFAILDQFRSLFPEAESFLMDRATLLAHRELWTSEATPTRAELRRLSAEEAGLYDELRRDLLAPALRLEQERLGFSWIEAAVAADPPSP